MRRASVLTLLALFACWPSTGAAQSYVRGDFCSACTGNSAVNQLYDDGLHGDGAAGDGVFGASIVVDRPAGKYSWTVVASTGTPMLPACGCQSPGTPAALWTTGPGDVIHFRTGGGPAGAGWIAPGLSCDHATPAGEGFQAQYLVPSNPFTILTACTASKSGSIWSCSATIPAAAQYLMRFKSPSAAFTRAYNANCTCPTFEEAFYWVGFTTVQPNSDVRFEFDEITGALRAQVLGPTPASRPTWGALKTIYR